jgi:O-antigen ligase
MPHHIKVLIVILFIASFVWVFLHKTVANIISKKDFLRWRNAWLSITLVAFLSHNFWIFVAITSSLLVYFSKSEENKVALYFVLLTAVPTINLRIPGLFDITYIRILSLILFLPLLISFKKSADTPPLGKPLAEKLMFAFMILSTVLAMRGTTVGDALRYGFYGVMDYFLPYFAASRVIKNFDQLTKAMIALVIGCMLAGAIGFFEFTNAWLLYNPLPSAMGVSWDMGIYLARGDNLRALSSLGHSLVLGFYMMIGFGFYLFIGKYIKNKLLWLISLGFLIAGLISPLSRGPWLGSAVLLLTFIAFGPKTFKRFSIAIFAAIITIQSLYWIPGGEKVLNLLPFIGEVDKFNIEYRELLLEKSILVIKQYPLFGVFDAKILPEMQELVQGQGFIDVVNSYLGIALGMGLVGLGLFIGIFVVILVNLRKSMKKIVDKRSDEYLCGRSLMATMIASMFTITTVSGIGIIPTLYWSIAGLIFTYARVTKQSIKTNLVAEINVKNSYPTFRLKKQS